MDRGTARPKGQSLADPLATALGLVSWPYPPEIASSTTAPTSQTVYARAIWLPAGQNVTNMRVLMSTAGAGTTPTGIFVGFANATTVLAQSSNIAANAIWTGTGFKDAPLSATWTVPSSGLYYGLLLQNGSWSVTQMSVSRAGATNPTMGSSLLYATGGTAATGLPSNGSAITLASSGSPVDYWFAAS